MTVRRMEQVAIVVEDLDEAEAFFAGLGLERIGDAAVEGAWVDRVVGLDDVRSDVVMMQTPDGDGRVELIRYQRPASPARDAEPPPHAVGLRHVGFSVDHLDDVVGRLRSLGFGLVGEVGEYDGVIRLCYVRGPSGIIVMLAQEIG